jgi:hypothetical protein
MIFKENTVLITTNDTDLFDDLANLPEDVTIAPIAAAGLSIDLADVTMYLVSFGHDLAIIAFTTWLSKRMESKDGCKTCIKGIEVVNDPEQIMAAIKVAFKQNEAQNAYHQQQYADEFPDASSSDIDR